MSDSRTYIHHDRVEKLLQAILDLLKAQAADKPKGKTK